MWEQIRSNQRKSLMLIFSMAVILTALGYLSGELVSPGAGPIGVVIAVGIFVIQLLLYFGAAESIFLYGTGAKEVTQAEAPQLYNIVEEMKIASGLPFFPKIYILPTESPNAFAIGRKPENSAVAVTQGLLSRLNRDELQGVIAHEIAHLQNTDTKFMMLAGIFLGSIIMLSEIMLRGFGRTRGRSISRSDNNSSNKQAELLIILLAVLLLIIGPILARILYFALSRSREYLADACAAQYTRYPEGLASALLKISGSTSALGQVSQAAAPMYVINPLQAMGGSVFSTHPPTEKRVQVLRSMGGASFSDYNNAFKAVTGKGIIGTHSLQESSHLDIRAASEAGPIVSRAEIRNDLNRLNGYIALTCQCGANLSVPPTFKKPFVICMRCETKNPIEMPNSSPESSHSSAQETPDDPSNDVQMYVRRSLGWESVPCKCGGTVQLSPTFSAPRIRCNSCNRFITILPPAGV